MMSKLCTQVIMQFIEGTGFHASLGRTGMKKRASFQIFVRQIRTTVRKWELCGVPCLMHTSTMYKLFISDRGCHLISDNFLNIFPLQKVIHTYL